MFFEDVIQNFRTVRHVVLKWLSAQIFKGHHVHITYDWISKLASKWNFSRWFEFYNRSRHNMTKVP
jgi:hypothetical protein